MKCHVSRFAVEWAHCDAAGIVFYPQIYIWFDQGTERLFKANGLGYAALESEFGVAGMPLLETGATYKNPCRIGDELEIKTWVEQWNRKTFVVKHIVTHADGRVALDGFERRAWIERAPDSPKGMRSVEIPAVAIERFED